MSQEIEYNINKSISNMKKTSELVNKIENELKNSVQDLNKKIHIDFSPTIKIEISRNDLLKQSVKKKPGPKPGKKSKAKSKAKKKPGPKKYKKYFGLF